MAMFTEFESRLRAAFPDDFGQRFESVAKWFLETDPRFASQLERVWLWDEWPGRWGPDDGIDLVAETVDGKTWAVQAKCYDEQYSATKSDVEAMAGFTHGNPQLRSYFDATREQNVCPVIVYWNGPIMINVTEFSLSSFDDAPTSGEGKNCTEAG